MDRLECVCGATTSNRTKGVVIHMCSGTPHVVHAPADVLFTNQMILVTSMRKHLYCRLEKDRDTTCTDNSHHPVGQPCFTGWLLHIDADRHVVYRIGDYLWLIDEWEGKWPD